MEYATDPIQHFCQLDLDQFLTVRRSLAKTTAVSSGSACTSASLEPCAAKWKLEWGKKLQTVRKHLEKTACKGPQTANTRTHPKRAIFLVKLLN